MEKKPQEANGSCITVIALTSTAFVFMSGAKHAQMQKKKGLLTVKKSDIST